MKKEASAQERISEHIVRPSQEKGDAGAAACTLGSGLVSGSVARRADPTGGLLEGCGATSTAYMAANLDSARLCVNCEKT